MRTRQILFAATVSVAIAWIGIDLSGFRARQLLDLTPVSASHAETAMPSLDGAVGWLNTPPLDAAALRGKVVLVQFLTYSCINWHRTLPHVRAWAEKYKAHGLVVLGVHTPEFAFEKDVSRIRVAMLRLDIGFPIAVDSNHKIWRAFGNDAWPALYFVDARGFVRHLHLGEGEYERSERVIQQLLAEAGAVGVGQEVVSVSGGGTQAAADWSNLRTQETYTGYARAHNFSSPGRIWRDQDRQYETPEELRLNTWALDGEWRIEAEAAIAQRPGGRIQYKFQARDLHIVMGPTHSRRPIPFRVLVDGRPPGPAHGTDIDSDGMGVLVEHRLYQLVRQPDAIQPRRFEIQFLAPGAEVFSFTFG